MERISCLKWLGGVLVLLGIAVVVMWESVLTHFIHKAFSFSRSSEVYPIWLQSQIPVTLDIYLFNCTNTEELSRNFKPHFQEVGPYRFKEHQNKVNVTWNDNNTVTYRQQRFWYFDEAASASAMEENITMLNLPPVTARYKAKDMGYLAALSVSLSMKVLEKSIWVTRAIKEFLFEGYPDPLLTLSSIFSGGDKERVGFFYGRNGSYTNDGYFNMETGVPDISKIGLLRQWNFDDKTSSYDDGCNEVEGYLGNFFPPKMTKDPFYFFGGDVCKHVKFYFSEEVEVLGLKGYRFVPEMELMDNAHTNPDSACNCGEVCMPQGVLDLTRCLKGVPLFGSHPHFLGADPFYLKNITGLSPVANRSHFHIIVEPTLGIPIEIAAHLQYNTLLKRDSRFSLFEDVPNLMFPLFWVRKRFAITEEVAQKLKMVLFLPTLGTICGVGLILLGLLTLSISLWPRFFKKTQETTKLRNRKFADGVTFSKTNGMTFKGEEEEKEKECMNEKNNLSNEDKMLKLLNCKETDILT